MFLANTLVLAHLFLYVVGSSVEDTISGEEKVHFGDPPKEDYPSIVAIGYITASGRPWISCGASLITERHILTAAHCFSADRKEYLAVLGSRNKWNPGPDSQQVRFGPEAWTLNPGYKGKPNGYVFDTAVITLPENVTLSETVQPTRLAKEVYENNVRVVGWGKKDCDGNLADEYLYAKGWIVQDMWCSLYYGSVHKSQFCAQYRNEKGNLSGSDSGDSGGPVYATADDGKDVQIGAVSLSKKQNGGTPQECTNPKIPMKYAKMAEAEVFIKSVAPNAEFV